jgi:transcriptional regulator with GAF, ATPase, and Fis domain
VTTIDRRVCEVFVELVDTLALNFDILDYLDRLAARCTELLNVSACGVLLLDEGEVIDMVAATSEQAHLLDLYQLRNSEGPSLDAFRTGRPARRADLASGEQPWPHFAAAAVEAGYVAAQALPMRLRETTIGVVSLFNTVPGPLRAGTLVLGQALVDTATISIIAHQAITRHEARSEQLQAALDTRVAIEQAKGILAQRLGMTIDDAFGVLRAYSRANNRRIAAVATDVISGRLKLPSTPHRHPSS